MKVRFPSASLLRFPEMTRVRWITQHHKDRLLALNLHGGVGLVGDGFGYDALAFLGGFFQRIGEVDAQSLIVAERVASLLQLQPNFQMSNCIGGHQKFKSEDSV